MLEAKQIDDWNHTAALMAWLGKLHIGKKARNLDASKFHPFGRTKSVRRKLSKQESINRLNQLVGITDARNTPNDDNSPGQVEHGGRSGDDGGGG